MNSGDIGVVVIGRNEGSRLIGCLKSVLPRVKCVVYVDSGSTDGSIQAAKQLGASVVPLDADQPFTAARARNEGFVALMKISPDTRFVQFIDGDCELDKRWIDTGGEFIRKRDDIAVVCGQRREQYPSASVYNRLCEIEWDTQIGEASACGGDSLMRAMAFKAVGGFREQLIAGEEPELCLRFRERGWKIWRLDAEMTRHDAAMTRFRQWWVRTVRSGYGITEVCLLHWHSPFAIWKKHIARSVFWGASVPVSVVLAALVYPAAVGAFVVYPLQICRIAIARGPVSSHSWAYASFMTLAKFAECQGLLTFCWRRLRRRSIKLIEYK